MSYKTTMTVTVEGIEDVRKLSNALIMAGLEEGNSPKPRENLTKEETPVAKELPKVTPDKPKAPKKKRKTWLTKPVKSHLRVLASEGKTIRDAEVITGVPYATIYQWARGQSVVFDKSKMGRPRKVVPLNSL